MYIKMFNSQTYFLFTMLTILPKSRTHMTSTLSNELVADNSVADESVEYELLPGELLANESLADEPLSSESDQEVSFQNETNSTLTKFEGFIVGGSYAKIEDFPHSAFMVISCYKKGYEDFTCGSSILNQWILLTAAHCFDGCQRGTKILISVGSRTKTKGTFYTVGKFANHADYDGNEMKNDIAMAILVKPLVFGTTVKRVRLSKFEIYNESALLAGWGVTDVIYFLLF